MRILLLTNLFPSPWLPHRAPFNLQQARALANDHSVQVIAPVSWTDRLRANLSRQADDLVIRDGLVVHHPTFYFTPGFLRHRHGDFYRRSVRGAFGRALELSRPDVVLAAWAYPDVFAAAELCRQHGLPLVAKVHGSDILLPRAGSKRALLTASGLKQAQAVITVSRHLAEAVRSLGVELSRVHTVYNGVDQTLFHPGPTRNQLPTKRLLFIGNLVPVKAVNVLIDACALLRERGVNFVCDLYGNGPLRGTLGQQISRLKLDGTVLLQGSRPLSALADAYRSADLLVLPSLSEGVPNVILEAIACGTPVVATRVGGVPEVLDQNVLVDPGDPAALAAAIAAQLASPCRPQFRTGSWADSARQVADVLQHVVQCKSRRAA